MGNPRHIILKINTRLRSINRVAFILILITTLLLVKHLFNFIYGFIEGSDIIWSPFPREEEKVVLFFITVIAAPLFETWFCQSLPYSLLNKVNYFKERVYLILLISAFFFGVNHFYSLFYMIYGFLMGLVFMYGYMVRIKTDNKTFYLIAITHSLVNLITFIKNLF
jgi:uncharacterized protein